MKGKIKTKTKIEESDCNILFSLQEPTLIYFQFKSQQNKLYSFSVFHAKLQSALNDKNINNNRRNLRHLRVFYTQKTQP